MTLGGPSAPSLHELVGDWLRRDQLEHLPSLRNQWGQAHVNADLTSLSWLALPPFAGGYHTGVLQVDGTTPAAERFRWAPWGVQREARLGAVVVRSETRMPVGRSRVLWRLDVHNEGGEARTVSLAQELLSAVAVSEVDWGWTYGQPWSSGHHHDYHTMERLRSELTEEHPRQVQFLASDARILRLGRPRLPGIQRDEDSSAMLLETSLPDHSTSDSGRTRAPGIRGRVRQLALGHPGESTARIGGPTEYALEPETEIRLDAVSLGDGAEFAVEVRSEAAGQSGVIVTHGNHPDSLQLGLERGAVWFAIGGERETTSVSLDDGAWHRISVTVSARGCALLVDAQVAATTRDWRDSQRWLARRTGDQSIEIEDSRSAALSSYTFEQRPEQIRVQGAQGIAEWTLTLAPGESARLEFRLDLADRTAIAHERPLPFAAEFDGVRERWKDLWSDAFRPGNAEYSGHLPVFETDDDDLARTYYLGALLAIYLRNTRVSPLGPVFLTGGPRLGPTTTYYWDQSEWARTAALLEPVALRAWIVEALTQPYDRSHSFDTRNLLPVGNHYASNDHALFRIVKAYVGVTGDVSVLHEEAAGRRVLDHLRELAFRPLTRQAGSGAPPLVDFGDDAWELLECVPNYRHAVVSFNAGYVGMLRDYAALVRIIGEPEWSPGAESAEQVADRLAAAVLDRYAGAGRWFITGPDGQQAIGHCLDFAFVAAEMTKDLDGRHRRELADFVTERLIDGDWMRALDPGDPIAPFSDRPDHGAAGAFAAWPGATAFGLFRLGRDDAALGLLRRAHRATSGGLWGQAMEAMPDGGYRVAERGVSNRESNAAIAVTETILAGLFGIEADFESLGKDQGRKDSAHGRLHGVRAIGFDLPRPAAAGRLVAAD